jgi:N-hydroxyarylamine O-acetyltransferase
LEKMADGGWSPQYEFSTANRELEEFEEMCTFQQTSPDSIFTKKVVCSLAKSDGRVTYANGRLLETRSGAKTSKEIQGEAELRGVFQSEFGFAIEGDHSKLLREPESD